LKCFPASSSEELHVPNYKQNTQKLNALIFQHSSVYYNNKTSLQISIIKTTEKSTKANGGKKIVKTFPNLFFITLLEKLNCAAKEAIYLCRKCSQTTVRERYIYEMSMRVGE